MIGHWLAGHEPGNFGFFHIARERGLSNVLDPTRIPIYLWENGVPVPAQLTDFKRFALKTPYLQRNYDGHDEPWMHRVNEPYDYGTASESYGNRK